LPHGQCHRYAAALPQELPMRRLFLPVLLALAGCATLPAETARQPAGPVQRQVVALAEGFHIVRMQGEQWLGCTALRAPDSPGADGEGAHVGLVRMASGQEMLALGGTRAGLSLGARRRVPVTIDMAGSQDAGSGLLDQEYFNVLTSVAQVVPLRAGATARLRFDGGFTAERSFSPGVIEALSRCYSQALAAAGHAPAGLAPAGLAPAGLAPADAAARLPMARGGSAKVPPGALSPDVAGVSIE
jgi:hypothetical protein